MAEIETSVLRIGSNDLVLQDGAARGSLADAYSASSTYAVGDMVLKDGQLYECNTAITTAEAWTAAHWTAVTVGGELSTVKDGLFAAFVTDTASGSIASFSDGADGVPVKSLTVDIEPVQSGSGDPSPTNIRPISGHTSATVTRCGKNLATKTIHGYVRVSDKKVLIDNDSESVVFYAESGKTYTVSSSATMGRSILGLASTDEITSGFQLDNAIELSGSVNTWTATWTGWTVWYKCPNAQSAFANSVQVEQGSTATTYEPYNGQTVTISLNGTRYGGTLNVGTGVLTVDRAFIASYNGETLPSTWISDRDVYAAGTTPTTGAQVCYKVATPQTIQLTANEVKTLLGQNNIWSDAGTVDVDYRADTKLYIEKLTAPTEDDMIADHAISANTFFMVGNTLYRATTAIASGATITVGTNATRLSLSDALNALS